MGDVGRSDIANRGGAAVAGNDHCRKGVVGQLIDVAGGESQGCGVERREVRTTVVETVIPVTHRKGGRIVDHEDVVEGKEVDRAQQQAGVGIARNRPELTEEGRSGLTRFLPGVHAGGRPCIVPALVDFDRLLMLRTIEQGRHAVVGLAGVGCRHAPENRPCHRVDAVGGNAVVWKRVADILPGAIETGRQRIVDDHRLTGGIAGLREIAGALERGRQGQHVVARAELLVVVRTEPEECAVLHDWSANRPGPVAEVLRWIGDAGFLGEVQLPGRPARFVHQQGATVPGIRTRSRRGVEHAARRVAHVGFIGLGLHPHFFDRFNRRHDGRSIDEVGHRHPFDQIAVAAPRPAAQ